MFEGSAKEITETDFDAALAFAQQFCQPLIEGQKQLAARVGKKKREIKRNVVPDEILHEAKALAGDRMVPALLIPAKLAREAGVKAVADEVGVKLVEKFGGEKETEVGLKNAFYYIQKEAGTSRNPNNGRRLH